ncbi:hypothetical protein YPPY60_1288 [Yersinia pestis PY-60]|uniref:Secreted protein n=1 Tax=Yersinia pestis PY-08 TaxID=992134 RepID=A0AB72ZMN5_YERPE|nr:hypothetical protein YPPY08_1290 [Yersinia pestis PY-08]EIS46733.1 hypothetical protein YPPY60_1288 [Yersinia pestis PY-60]
MRGIWRFYDLFILSGVGIESSTSTLSSSFSMRVLFYPNLSGLSQSKCQHGSFSFACPAWVTNTPAAAINCSPKYNSGIRSRCHGGIPSSCHTFLL